MYKGFLALGIISVMGTAVADPSLECSVNSSSQVETADCLISVENATNEALAIILGFARDGAKELDEITERDMALPALEASQTAWEAHRDAFCDYAGTLFGGGSGTGIEIRSCRIEITRDRIKALRSKIN